MKDIMLDIETFGTSNRAVIVSVGACHFDIETGQIGEVFYTNISVASCVDHGLEMDDRTLNWWAGQYDTNPEAAQALAFPKPIPLLDACMDFRAWVKSLNKGNRLWGNGVGFDNIILRHAFDAVGIGFPIFFTEDMDVRTLVYLGPPGEKKKVKKEGTAHNALDDARHQAAYVSNIYRKIKRVMK